MEIRLDYTEERNFKEIVSDSTYLSYQNGFWNLMRGLDIPLCLDYDGVVGEVPVTNGILILESPPQSRIIPARKSQEEYLKFNYKKAKFNYLLHIIQYVKYKDKHLYLGIGNRSLSVFQSDKSLETLDSEVELSFTDTYHNGVVCLSHEDEFSVFPSKEKLVDFILNSWWNISHEGHIDYIKPIPHSLREMVKIPTRLLHKIGPVYFPESSELIKKKYNGNQT
jgi:hypothetical protein